MIFTFKAVVTAEKMMEMKNKRRKKMAMPQACMTVSWLTSACRMSSKKWQCSTVSVKEAEAHLLLHCCFDSYSGTKRFHHKSDVTDVVFNRGEDRASVWPVLETFTDRVVFPCVTLQVMVTPGKESTGDRRRKLWMLNFPSGPLWGWLLL